MIVLLDSGVVSLIIRPRDSAESQACNEWIEEVVRQGHEVVLPEIVDYEVRRGLLRIDSQMSLDKLDRLQSTATYLPITTDTMRRAAQLWADARRARAQTADDKTIDADMILVAQAQEIAAARGLPSVVATANIRHLSRFLDARHWRDIP